jgi:glycosyltransferase involved in cell wall biosynthesis
VLLDGGTDDTLNRLERFKDRIRIERQENHGLAFTRNRLVEMAKGDILAFLDSDDLWHPKYLEVQRTLLRNYPDALVSFVGHVDFTGLDHAYVWRQEPDTDCTKVEWMNQVDFFKRYFAETGLIGLPSFGCVRRAFIKRLGSEPYQFDAASDCYLFYQVSLFGGVVFYESPLGAYRVSETSMSANRLRIWPQVVNALAKLEPEFKKSGIRGLRQAFPKAYAGSRRYYAKMLLGVGRYGEARYQLLQSMAICRQPGSFAKSFGIWAASWLPVFLQPKWPSYTREIGGVVAPPPSPSPAVGRAKS